MFSVALDSVGYTSELQRLRAELRETQLSNAQLESTKQELHAALSEVTERSKKLSMEHTRFLDEFREKASKSKTKLHQERTALKQSLKQLTDELQNLQHEKHTIEQNNIHLQQVNFELQEQLQNKTTQLQQQLDHTIQQSNETVEKLHSDLHQQHDHYEQLQQQYEAATTMIEELQQTIQTQKVSIEELETRLNSKQQEVISLATSLKTQNATIESFQTIKQDIDHMMKNFVPHQSIIHRYFHTTTTTNNNNTSQNRYSQSISRDGRRYDVASPTSPTHHSAVHPLHDREHQYQDEERSSTVQITPMDEAGTHVTLGWAATKLSSYLLFIHDQQRALETMLNKKEQFLEELEHKQYSTSFDIRGRDNNITNATQKMFTTFKERTQQDIDEITSILLRDQQQYDVFTTAREQLFTESANRVAYKADCSLQRKALHSWWKALQLKYERTRIIGRLLNRIPTYMLKCAFTQFKFFTTQRSQHIIHHRELHLKQTVLSHLLQKTDLKNKIILTQTFASWKQNIEEMKQQRVKKEQTMRKIIQCMSGGALLVQAFNTWKHHLKSQNVQNPIIPFVYSFQLVRFSILICVCDLFI